MVALEAAMKKQHINLDSSSESTSHGHTHCASSYSYTASSSFTQNKWLIDSGESYHMAKDQVIFSTMYEFNTKQIFVGNDRSVSVVGSGIVPVENGHFSDVLVFQEFSAICCRSIKSLILVKVQM